jgi:hypothetical protein
MPSIARQSKSTWRARKSGLSSLIASEQSGTRSSSNGSTANGRAIPGNVPVTGLPACTEATIKRAPESSASAAHRHREVDDPATLLEACNRH